MKFFKGISFTIILLIFTSLNMLAQNNEASSIEVENVPQTPGVAQLGKYGSPGINKYNGSANINIPIYNLKFEDIRLPINLSYNTSGIKVNEDAPWAGLGWSLFEGIVITREINGFDDLRSANINTGGMYDAESIGWIFSRNFITNSGHPNYRFVISPADSTLLAQSQTSVPYDTEPDLFTANLPTGSVQFYLPKIENGAQILEADIINDRTHKIYYDVYNESFTVIDPNGYQYEFSIREFSTSFSSWDAPNATTELIALQGISYWHTSQTRKLNSAWKLSKIKAYNGRELFFEYEDGFFFSFPSFSEKSEQTIHGHMGHGSETRNISTPIITASLTAFHKKYLTKISGDFGSVNFILGNRIDLYSKEAQARFTQMPMWEPAISPNVNNAKKLESIEVRNIKNNLVKKIDFSYSYFNDHKIQDPYKERFLRLKLDSVSSLGKTYQFQYINPNALPAKDSKSVDFWGYYNGKTNNIRIPTANRFFLVMSSVANNYQQFEKFYKFKGANRSTDFLFGRYGNLSRIIYPTGGYTDFNYEGHTVSLTKVSYSPRFDNNGELADSGLDSSEDYNFNYQYLKLADDDNYSLYNNNNCNVIRSYIDVNNSFYVDSPLCGGRDYNFFVQVTLHCNTGCEKDYTPTGRAVWVENLDTGEETTIFSYDLHFSNGDYDVNLEKEILLEPGNYILKNTNWVQTDPFLVVVTSYVNATSWRNEASDQIIPEVFNVGGCRLSKILNYDTDGELINKRKFTYTTLFNDSLEVSSGKLMDELIYTSKGYGFQEYTPEDYSDGNGNVAYIHSSNMVRTRNSAAGSHIGYDLVGVETIDSSGNSNGLKQFSYVNRPNEYLTRYIGLVPVCFGVGDCINVSYGDVYLLGTSPISYENFNGKVMESRIFDTTGNLLQHNVNEYYIYDGGFPSFVRFPILFWAGNVFSTNYFYKERINTEINDNKIFKLKNSKITKYFGNETIKDSINYFYNNQLLNHLTVGTNSKGIIERNLKYYPADLTSEPFMTQLIADNRYAVIKTESFKEEDGQTKLIGSTSFQYANDVSPNQLILVEHLNTWKGSHEIDGKKIIYDKYDQYGNLLQFHREKDAATSFIWSYNGRYPVAKIENASYAEIASVLGYSENDLMNIGYIELDNLNSLRNLLPSSKITTYTYEPLVGVTSITDPKGRTTTYHYDSFNRLEFVKDEDGNILKELQYHYKTN